MGRPLLSAAIALVALCLIPAGVLRGIAPLVQVGDAYVIANGPSGWAIGNSLMRFTLSRQGGATVIGGITDVGSGHEWSRSNGADGFITVNNQRFNLGSTATPLVNATTTEWWGGARLDLHYRIASMLLDITRSYAVYPGSPIVEVWTTYQTRTRTVTLSDLNTYAISIENGTMKWITGLNTPDDSGGPFTIKTSTLDNNQTMQLGADAHASESFVPWYSVVTPDAEFFGAVLWTGSWRVLATRHGDNIDLQAGMPSFHTALGINAALETPHAIFGMTTTTTPEVSMAMKGFIDKGLRHGRPYSSLVTYNTWYSYGTFVDEGSMLAEMDLAAASGAQQFVIDAGWWPSINGADPGDFVHGWGTYDVDMGRFPNGLGALSDHAHELGMKFGIWVEPERVDRNTVGQPGGASEPFLAMRDGRYDPGTPNSSSINAQVCLADPHARDWVMGRLVQLIDQARPDYLKWDNNFWVNCNRAGHGHGAEDGNFVHMNGLSMVLSDLRNRYPDMQIEDCSSGGNRVSLDMLTYTDTAWLDDRTSPSEHVRHNLEGLLTVFPAPYLLTFAVSTADEPMVDDGGGPSVMPVVLRSRMPGILGLSILEHDMDDGTRVSLANQIALYQRIRLILLNSTSFLLSSQVVSFPDQPWSGWDVTEHVSATTGDAVVLAFDTLDAPSSTLVRLKGLKPDVTYQVESADYGDLGSVAGADVMAQGIQINASDLTHSHVIILHAQPAAPARR